MPVFSVTVAPSQEAFFLSLQLLDMSHRRWSPCNASVALEFGDIHSLAAAAFVSSSQQRGLDVAPQQQQHPLPPGPGPPQPVRTLPGLLTALAASHDRRLDSSHVPGLFRKSSQLKLASWSQFAMRWGPTRRPTGFIFSPRAFSSRRNNFGNAHHPLCASHSRSPSSLSRSAFLVAAGCARDCPLAPDITPGCFGSSAWFVTCLLLVCLLHAGAEWV